MSLNLPELFKTFSNQTRIEIAVLLFDSCASASEIAETLQVELSTIYRHLKHMKKLGILKSTHSKGIERFDFSSPRIFRILEEAIGFVNETKGYKFFECSNGICNYYYSGDSQEEIEPDILLDVRGEACPVPDIRTRDTLEQMKTGEILLVIVDYPLSGERIPISVIKGGNELLKRIVDEYGDIRIYIRRQ